jgi:hypothetical protein
VVEISNLVEREWGRLRHDAFFAIPLLHSSTSEEAGQRLMVVSGGSQIMNIASPSWQGRESSCYMHNAFDTQAPCGQWWWRFGR